MQQESTVGAWTEDWFKGNSVRWCANTTGGYRNLIDHHIISGAGNVPLTELMPTLISTVYQKLAADGLSTRSVWSYTCSCGGFWTMPAKAA